MAPLIPLIYGVGLYLILWLSPAIGIPNPRSIGEWKTAPAWLRRLLRRDSGPVLIAALLWQVVAIFSVLIAALWVAGLLSQPLGAIMVYMGALALVIASIVFFWFVLIERRPGK